MATAEKVKPEHSEMEYAMPDAAGRFGAFGGSYVAETLTSALADLRAGYAESRADAAFASEFARALKEYVGRPNPVYRAARLEKFYGGAPQNLLT